VCVCFLFIYIIARCINCDSLDSIILVIRQFKACSFCIRAQHSHFHLNVASWYWFKPFFPFHILASYWNSNLKLQSQSQSLPLIFVTKHSVDFCFRPCLRLVSPYPFNLDVLTLLREKDKQRISEVSNLPKHMSKPFVHYCLITFLVQYCNCIQNVWHKAWNICKGELLQITYQFSSFIKSEFHASKPISLISSRNKKFSFSVVIRTVRMVWLEVNRD
jgi:hypothetical protein